MTRRIENPRRWWLAGLGVSAGVLALLPWWRHHDYLRDFYDYGLVIAGVGRIAGGERPYVDFLTPIQSGLFLFNWLAETLGGGNFLGMVRGGAAFTGMTLAALWFVLARRLAAGPALLIAFAVTVGGAAQHTIIWHNTVGVFSLALAVWGGAIGLAGGGGNSPGGAGPPPVGLGWILLVALALWIGGINKLNFHLLALAVVLGWVIRAVVVRRISGREGLGLGLFWFACGTALPVLTELGWTGASLSAWWRNVVTLPFGQRTGTLADALDWKFYLVSPHVYYGELLLPQAGLLGLVLAGIAGRMAWKNTFGAERWLAAGAALLAAAGGVALLATNNEISHVALAASLVLAAALWLGFSVPFQGAPYRFGLLGLAGVVAAGTWWSAWLGQRSQFGHSAAPRSTYLPVEQAGPGYAYMRGIKVPPEIVGSLEAWHEAQPPVDAKGRLRVYYGPGAEWLTRIFPARHYPDLPLWLHGGTSFGAVEERRLASLIGEEGAFSTVLRPEAWITWGKAVDEAVARHYEKYRMGPVIFRWDRKNPTRDIFADTIEYLNRFGGNIHADRLQSDDWPLVPLSTVDGRSMLGVARSKGVMRLRARSSRVEGEAIVRRSEGAGSEPAWVDFRVSAWVNGVRQPRWTRRVEIPAGRDEVATGFLVDSSGGETDFQIVVPEKFAGKVWAGYRGPFIRHVDQPAGPAPRLRRRAGADAPADPAITGAMIQADWAPEEIVHRGGRVTANGFELPPGGEVWIRATGFLSEFSGDLMIPPDNTRPGFPVFRAVWAKGARMEILGQGNITPGSPGSFRMWSAEPNAWFGIINDEAEGGPPIVVRIRKVVRSG